MDFISEKIINLSSSVKARAKSHKIFWILLIPPLILFLSPDFIWFNILLKIKFFI